MKIDIFIIDFDSTFISVESLDFLTKVALNRNPKRKEILSKMDEIKQLSLKSKLDFKNSLKMKMQLLTNILEEKHLIKTSGKLEKYVSPDILKIIYFAREHNKKIIVLSNSFRILMKKIMDKYGIETYFANRHIINKYNFFVGYDETNHMANDNGKENVVNFLKNVKLIVPNEKIIMIGDGMSDYRVYQNKCCDYFLNFAINENRKLKKYKSPDDKNFIIARKSEDIDSFLKSIE